mmetsp:Transcript_43962/g.106598  ORF Transcript_43962/g.106598 Transcript_43962/m.106598 type:complete len:154 (-) Transcript_43962:152-613(-)
MPAISSYHQCQLKRTNIRNNFRSPFCQEMIEKIANFRPGRIRKDDRWIFAAKDGFFNCDAFPVFNLKGKNPRMALSLGPTDQGSTGEESMSFTTIQNTFQMPVRSSRQYLHPILCTSRSAWCGSPSRLLLRSPSHLYHVSSPTTRTSHIHVNN